MKTVFAGIPAIPSILAASTFRVCCLLLLPLACVNLRGEDAAASKAAPAPLPYVTSTDGTRWDHPDFGYSIPALDSAWTVQPDLVLEAQDNLKVAREQVSFSANSDATRFELTVWDKKRQQSLKEWFNWLGKDLCGDTDVTVRTVTTPAGDKAIWANIEATTQAPQFELFFIVSKEQAYCVRYINKDNGTNRDAFKQLCLGLSPSAKSISAAATSTKSIGAPVSFQSNKVASCGPVVDACNCAGNNPYPCCANGSNCTWGAWDRMCCNWGYAANNWGNAETWGVYAQSAGNWVQSSPTVGSVGCRRVHSDTPYGHVAYVLQISGSSVYCIQMNCNVGGAGWSYQWFPISYFTGGYITRTNPNPAPPAVIVVDNTSGGFAASTGWATATSAADKYGASYRYKSTAALSDAATWTANITSAGNYTIAAWWTAGSNRSTTAPYILPNNATVSKNQQGNGGSWQNLGTVSLATGNRTTKLSCWTTTGFIVVADAIRYTKN